MVGYFCLVKCQIAAVFLFHQKPCRKLKKGMCLWGYILFFLYNNNFKVKAELMQGRFLKPDWVSYKKSS